MRVVFILLIWADVLSAMAVAAERTIDIANSRFQPQTVTIGSGDKVTWLNQDGTPHTTTSTANPPVWDSDILFQSESFSFTFAGDGKYPYHCDLHPSEIGVIIVGAGTTNSRPAIAISSPASGSGFAASDPIAIEVETSDTDGFVVQVEFLAGTTRLGTSTNAPFSFTVTNLPPGSYTLTARATDNEGATTTSSAVAISVNQPPTVTITTPADGASFAAPATFTIEANATDPDGSVSRVEFFADSNLLGARTTSPYRLTVTNFAVGSYSLTAAATDNQGAVTTSAPVVIAVITAENPVVRLTARRATSGPFQFDISGLPAGRTNVIQASTNLTGWISLNTNAAPSGNFSFTDSAATNLTRRFYRVLVP